jgi:hypothetical protein
VKVRSLQDYIQLVRQSGAEVLGSILWFSISGSADNGDAGTRRFVPVRITRNELEKHFDDLGLDKDFIPAPIRKVHAFRTACSETRRDYRLPSEGESVELMIREVTFDAEKRIHHVMREHKDSRGERLSYTHVATLKFYRGSKSQKNQESEHYKATILRGLDKLDEAEVEGLIHEFDERYTDLAANLHGQVIRSMLRRYLESLNAIKVRKSGGIYFIHSSKQETVDALAELVAKLGDGCTFFQTPLPDLPNSREMLTDAFQDEVEDDVRELLGEIADYNEKIAKKGQAPSEVKFAEFRTRYEVIMARASEYSEVLGLQQERAAVALEMALEQVDAIAGALGTTPKKKGRKSA